MSHTSPHPTHYEILEVSEEASQECIYKSFRRLSRVYHPDSQRRGKMQCRVKNRSSLRASGPISHRLNLELQDPKDDGDMFKKLCNAKEVLTNTEKRIAYNISLFGEPKSKWKGSEAREFEEEFYYDMQSKASKIHREKPGPVVLRKDVTPGEWMNSSKDYHSVVFYDKTILCHECHGYAKVPFTSSSEGSAMKFMIYPWDPLEYTSECSSCTGTGFLLKDSSVQANQKRKRDEEQEEIDHATPEAFSTTITAEIESCPQCRGKKRVLNPNKHEKGSFTSFERCSECSETGIRTLENVAIADVPLPNHFDAETKTSIVVLLGEGNQWTPNQVRGDVHIIFTMTGMNIPCSRSTVVSMNSSRDTNGSESNVHLRRTKTLSDSTEQGYVSSNDSSASETESELDEEAMDDEGNVKADVDAVYGTEMMDVLFMGKSFKGETHSEKVDLQASKDGLDFHFRQNISLMEALCGVQLKIPSFDNVSREEELRDYASAKQEDPHVFRVKQGCYTWTGDIWDIKDMGPRACDLECGMPPFVHPKARNQQSVCYTTPKIAGSYPGFAPCLFARKTKEEDSTLDTWVFCACAVSYERYPAHAQHTIVSFRNWKYRTHKVKRGSLRIDFVVDAPGSNPSSPEMFYQTIMWCCGKMGTKRDPKEYTFC